MLILEAMKMKRALLASLDGVVAELKFFKGTQVREGTLPVGNEDAHKGVV